MNAIGEAILQNLNTLIVVIDPKGEVSYTSPSVQRLLGFNTTELLEFAAGFCRRRSVG